MGKRVILNRSGKITAARPGADPINTMNRAPVSAEAETARADAAEARVLQMGEEVADLLVALHDLKQSNKRVKQLLDTVQTKCDAAAGVAEAKGSALQTKLEAAEKRAARLEDELAAQLAAAAKSADEEPAPTPAKTAPTKKAAAKKPARRKKKPTNA